MTLKGKSRNVLASPLGEEGHEVAKGVQANWIHRGAPRPANPVRRHPAKSVCTRVRMIVILDVNVTAERRHHNTHRPQGRYHNPRPERPSNLRTLRPSGRSILRTFPFTTLLHNLLPSGGHNPRGEAPSTLGPKGLSISLFHRASPGCRPCLSRRHSPVRPVSWLLFCCGRRSGSRR